MYEFHLADLSCAVSVWVDSEVESVSKFFFH